LKNIIFLLLSVTLLLSGCGDKQEQPSSSPATETTAPQDPASDTPEEAEKTLSEPAAPQEEQAPAPSKENSQSSNAPTSDTGNDSSKGTSSVTIQKDSTPTVAPAKETAAPPEPTKVQEKPTTSAPAAKPAAPAPPPPSKEPTPVEEKKTETVQLSIRGDKDRGVILPPTQVTYEDGDTVLKVLARSLKEKKIPMEYRGTGGAAYVEGIANLYEFDLGPTSGWMFRINGVFGSQSAGSVKLQPGDQLEWLYTLDLGKDIGATKS